MVDQLVQRALRVVIAFAPVNAERPLQFGGGREVVKIVALNPPSVVCEESIFANAVTTLGIPLIEYTEYRSPEGERRLIWFLEPKSIDGKYTLAQLRTWWHDPSWLAAHPAHELAIIRAASDNLLRFAQRVRAQPWLLRVTQECDGGRLAVHIPSDATDERRAELLAKLA